LPFGAAGRILFRAGRALILEKTMGLLEKGRSLISKAIDSDGMEILYSGDGDSIALTAIEGKTDYPVEKSGTVSIETTDADFLFPAIKLVLNGRLATPNRGHTIEKIDPLNGNRKYAVFNIPNQKCYRETAGMLRVHAKLIETDQ
jgi:hypothetical protein